jgi:hypothetical protein
VAISERVHAGVIATSRLAGWGWRADPPGDLPDVAIS